MPCRAHEARCFFPGLWLLSGSSSPPQSPQLLPCPSSYPCPVRAPCPAPAPLSSLCPLGKKSFGPPRRAEGIPDWGRVAPAPLDPPEPCTEYSLSVPAAQTHGRPGDLRGERSGRGVPADPGGGGVRDSLGWTSGQGALEDPGCQGGTGWGRWEWGMRTALRDLALSPSSPPYRQRQRGCPGGSPRPPKRTQPSR